MRPLILAAVVGSLLSVQAFAQVGPGCAIRNDGSSICMGDRVIDYRGALGMVQQMYPNGTMVVEYDNGSVYSISPYNLAREVSCINTVCFGTRVYDRYGNPGTVYDLFENGAAELTLDAYPNRYFVMGVNQITEISGAAPVPITHPWPAPRPYPDPYPPQPQPQPNR